ncbi:RICIN domain-containing protein [uncultured Streptomyces sp.]|uniref:RICIN domain-containing protein n=1 Tax=uncultured Streptomyces sp. TaxID=174707 RepID=UPI00261F207C|nr:RICIN domain-containing protein [uncultured Streptomyces sp.]
MHRPKKAMLAAAALAGSVLLAVPLLLAVQEPDKDEAAKADLAAGTTLQGDGPEDGAGNGGVYAAQSPSPTPSPTAPSPKASAGDDAPIVRQQAPAAASPKPSAAPKASAKAKAKAAAKPKKAPSHPSISRVLLKNLTTGMCADVPGYGKGAVNGPVNQFHCAAGNGDNQVWTLDMRYADTGPTGGDLYQIRNVKDGLCLDLPGYGPVASTTSVSEFPCNGTTGDNQLWWLDARPGGTYWIRSFSSDGLCLDVSNKDGGGPDARLTIFPCNDADDHRWSFLG